MSKDESTRADDERVSLQPLSFEEAMEGLLTPIDQDTREKNLIGLFESVAADDPLSKAAAERTEGFVSAEEVVERLRMAWET